jgi:N-acylneuraminate cytidylyltransferase
MSAQVRWPPLERIHTIAFDFDGVFTDNAVFVGADGAELVRCSRADGLGIDMLRAAVARGLLRAELFILSKEKHPVVQARARKLKLDCHHGYDDKLEFMRQRLGGKPGAGGAFAGLVYLGNDLNDLPLIERAGFSVAPADAHARVGKAASVVLPQRGGEGFVRAFVERLLDVESMTAEDFQQLLSR